MSETRTDQERAALIGEIEQRIAELDLWERDHVQAFENLAAEFYAETGFLAPGKSMPLEMGPSDDDARHKAWNEWRDARYRRLNQGLFGRCLALLQADTGTRITSDALGAFQSVIDCEHLREALRVIHKAVRGDEKGECWAIRKWLDKRDIFNDDISGVDRLVEEVCKALLQAGTPTAQTWHPIATAPKDGTEVLVSATWQNGGEIVVGRWVDAEGRWNAGYATSYAPEVVTHWMPLPPAPIAQEGK